jgi:hypothetical protein
MARERDEENEAPWWRGVPAMLTAAAAFIGALAALLALFLGPGGSDGGSDGEAAHSASTTTESSSVPPGTKLATEADVRKLLTFVPASVRSRCKQAPEEGFTYLARFSCDLGGATFYYELYGHELDAQASLSSSVSNAELFAKGRARSCGEARAKRPFVGTWTRPGQSTSGGRQLCDYDFGVTSIYWTETGRPIVGFMVYSGQNRESSVEGAQRVWERVMSE